MAPSRSIPLSSDMNKFYKKYVCYDPNLSRFSELGNVALNKTFWERTYATNKKFTHFFPVDLPSTLPTRNETPSYLKNTGNNNVKKVPKSTNGNKETPQSKIAKKLKNIVFKPKPPIEETCPFDECWPKSVLSGPSLTNTASQTSRLSSIQRRVSRLPSLPSIIETDSNADSIKEKNKIDQNSVVRTILSLQRTLKSPRKNSSSSSKEYNLPQSSMSSALSQPATEDNEQGPSFTKTKKAGKRVSSKSSFNPSALLALKKSEFWRDHRTKKKQSATSVTSRLVVTKDGNLTDQTTFRHPWIHLKKNTS